jgi:hypothetical protein
MVVGVLERLIHILDAPGAAIAVKEGHVRSVSDMMDDDEGLRIARPSKRLHWHLPFGRADDLRCLRIVNFDVWDFVNDVELAIRRGRVAAVTELRRR